MLVGTRDFLYRACYGAWCGLTLFSDGIRKRFFATIANDEVYSWKRSDGLRLHFCIATGDNEKRIGMAATGLADHLPRTAITQVGNGAGVDDVDISHFTEVALHKTCRAHLLANSFAVGLIYLAAERSNSECCFWRMLDGHVSLKLSCLLLLVSFGSYSKARL